MNPLILIDSGDVTDGLEKLLHRCEMHLVKDENKDIPRECLSEDYWLGVKDLANSILTEVYLKGKAPSFLDKALEHVYSEVIRMNIPYEWIVSIGIGDGYLILEVEVCH